MPVTAHFESDVLVVTASGTHTLAESRSAILSALDAPGAPAARGLVFDIRKSKSAAGRSKLPIRAAVAFLDSIRERYLARYALVVSTNTALQTVRLTVLGLEQLDIDAHIAPTVEDAVEWALRRPGPVKKRASA